MVRQRTSKCAFRYVRTHVYIYIYMYICIYICLYVYIHVHTYKDVCVSIYTCRNLYKPKAIYVCIISISIYIYMYV